MYRERGRGDDYDYERLLSRHKEERVYGEEYDPRRMDPRDPSAGYTSICLNNLNQAVPLVILKDEIYRQFNKFGDLNVRIVTSNPMNRIAFVNFADPEAAKDAKHHRKNLILFDSPVHIEPVYSSRYKGGQSPPIAAVNGNYRYEEFRQTGDHKFPYHLNHVTPEDDPYANRTLFVGNMDIEITETDVRSIFDRYGVIEEIDIKRPMHGQGNAYAFIKYYNVDMAHRAKVDMSGRFIGNYQCKIGYGKPTATNCLWIGGLGHWVKPEVLEQEFDRFGVINRIEWPHGKSYAYVLFDSVDAAVAANAEMRGTGLGGPDKRIRVDYADESHMPSKLKRSPRTSRSESDAKSRSRRSESNNRDDGAKDRISRAEREYSGSNSKSEQPDGEKYRSKNDYDQNSVGSDRKRTSAKANDERSYKSNPGSDRGHSRDKELEREPADKRRRTASPSSVKNARDQKLSDSERNRTTSANSDVLLKVDEASNIDQLSKSLQVVWNGVLVLKNSAFPAKMHLVSGDVHLVDTLMRDTSSTELPLLKITQRLRLDPPKLEEVGRRVESSGPGHAVLLAMPGAPESLEEASAATSNVQQRPLRNLVSYLKQKEAAGVISLPPSPPKDKENIGVLHAFPPCKFGNDFLLKQAPRLTTDLTKDDHLVIMVVRGAV